MTLARKPEAEDRMVRVGGGERWGRRVDRWHDERGPLHLLSVDNSPACGISYYMTTGGLPGPVQESAKCGRCRVIAQKRARALDLFGGVANEIACATQGCYLAVVDERGTCTVHGSPRPSEEDES